MTLCACGEPLHYVDPENRARVEALIAEYGELVTMTVPGWGSWRVPRHYIALHGLEARYLPALADRYGWEKVA